MGAELFLAGEKRAVVRWKPAAAEAVLARVAAGGTVRGVCREPGMPAARTVGKWLAERPEFAAAMAEARSAAGKGGLGPLTTYCEATAVAICRRLEDGEGIVAICRDPDMPANSTVYHWQAEVAAFRRAVWVAREIHAERMLETAWDLAMAAEPETAFLTKVRLEHLRWNVGKLAPRKYGPMKAGDMLDTPETRGAVVDEAEWLQACGMGRGNGNAEFIVGLRRKAEEAQAQAEAPAPVERRMIFKHFEVETDEANDRWRVNTYTPDPETMKPVKTQEGAWERMPPKDVRHEFPHAMGAARPPPGS